MDLRQSPGYQLLTDGVLPWRAGGVPRAGLLAWWPQANPGLCCESCGRVLLPQPVYCVGVTGVGPHQQLVYDLLARWWSAGLLSSKVALPRLLSTKVPPGLTTKADLLSTKVGAGQAWGVTQLAGCFHCGGMLARPGCSTACTPAAAGIAARDAGIVKHLWWCGWVPSAVYQVQYPAQEPG